MKIKKLLLMFVVLFLVVVSLPTSVFATTYDLIAPTGTLTSGQNLQFTVNINTEGGSLSSATIGMTYDTKYLQYVSAAPGNTFTTVSATDQGGGKLLVTGSSTAPYTGSGAFAYVTFKLIATSPGSTQLCALFNPSTPTSTPAPQATAPPAAPTALPKSGDGESVAKGVALASLFFAAAGGFIVFKKA